MVRHDVGNAVREMPTGTHAILVYDSPENKRDVLFNHLKYGEGREGLVYVCSLESPENIKEEMDDFGLDVDGQSSKGNLTVSKYDEVYVVNGKVHTSGIIMKFAEMSARYRAKGMSGIRAGAEMECFYKENKVPELLQYERALHRTFSFPAKGVCAYSLVEMANSGNLEMLWPLIRMHALVIMTGPNGSFALEPEKVSEEAVKAATTAALG